MIKSCHLVACYDISPRFMHNGFANARLWCALEEEVKRGCVVGCNYAQIAKGVGG